VPFPSERNPITPCPVTDNGVLVESLPESFELPAESTLVTCEEDEIDLPVPFSQKCESSKPRNLQSSATSWLFNEAGRIIMDEVLIFCDQNDVHLSTDEKLLKQSRESSCLPLNDKWKRERDSILYFRLREDFLSSKFLFDRRQKMDAFACFLAHPTGAIGLGHVPLAPLSNEKFKRIFEELYQDSIFGLPALLASMTFEQLVHSVGILERRETDFKRHQHAPDAFNSVAKYAATDFFWSAVLLGEMNRCSMHGFALPDTPQGWPDQSLLTRMEIVNPRYLTKSQRTMYSDTYMDYVDRSQALPKKFEGYSISMRGAHMLQTKLDSSARKLTLTDHANGFSHIEGFKKDGSPMKECKHRAVSLLTFIAAYHHRESSMPFIERLEPKRSFAASESYISNLDALLKHPFEAVAAVVIGEPRLTSTGKRYTREISDLALALSVDEHKELVKPSVSVSLSKVMTMPESSAKTRLCNGLHSSARERLREQVRRSEQHPLAVKVRAPTPLGCAAQTIVAFPVSLGSMKGGKNSRKRLGQHVSLRRSKSAPSIGSFTPTRDDSDEEEGADGHSSTSFGLQTVDYTDPHNVHWASVFDDDPKPAVRDSAKAVGRVDCASQLGSVGSGIIAAADRGVAADTALCAPQILVACSSLESKLDGFEQAELEESFAEMSNRKSVKSKLRDVIYL